jgi:hypothetical protein
LNTAVPPADNAAAQTAFLASVLERLLREKLPRLGHEASGRLPSGSSQGDSYRGPCGQLWARFGVAYVQSRAHRLSEKEALDVARFVDHSFVYNLDQAGSPAAHFGALVAAILAFRTTPDEARRAEQRALSDGGRPEEAVKAWGELQEQAAATFIDLLLGRQIANRVADFAPASTLAEGVPA